MMMSSVVAITANAKYCRRRGIWNTSARWLNLILDDEDDILYEQRNNFVNTSFSKGLTSEHVDLSIKILNFRK